MPTQQFQALAAGHSLLEEARAIVNGFSQATEAGRRLAEREADACNDSASLNQLRRTDVSVQTADESPTLKA